MSYEQQPSTSGKAPPTYAQQQPQYAPQQQQQQQPQYVQQQPQYVQQQPQYAPQQQPMYAQQPQQQPMYAQQPQQQPMYTQQPQQQPMYAQQPQQMQQLPVRPHGSVAAELMPGGWPSHGVVIRQVTQTAEAALGAFLPVEYRNVYKVAPLPAGVHVARNPSDPAKWRPSGDELDLMQASHHGVEQSSTALRCCLACWGGLNERPFTMDVKGADPTSSLFLDRPCRCCGCLGSSCEGRMDVYAGGHFLGQVRESCTPCVGRSCDACCCCTYHHDIRVPANGGSATAEELGAPPRQAMMRSRKAVDTVPMQTAYRLRVGLCCTPHNNLCGATCCQGDAVYDIMDASGTTVVSTIQRTYAPGGSGCNSSFCRCLNQFNNYVVEFPPDAPPGHRAVIVAATLQMDYRYFEKKGGDN